MIVMPRDLALEGIGRVERDELGAVHEGHAVATAHNGANHDFSPHCSKCISPRARVYAD